MLTRLLLLLFCLLTAPPALLAAPAVLFDEGHGQPFHVHGSGPFDLSSLAETFTAAGFEVHTSTGRLEAEALAGIDALVITGAFQPLSAEELSAVQAFLDRGGKLAVMLHIAPPLAGLLANLHIEYANGILYDAGQALDNNPQQFRVAGLAKHPLTNELPDFAVYGCWALRGATPAVEAVAWTSGQSWVDLQPDGRPGPGDISGAFALAVAGSAGAGRYVVFGDDALFQNRFLAGNNRRLAENLARWLAPGKIPNQMEQKLL